MIIAERASGVIAFNEAGGVLKNLELSGFDAGIISRNGNGLEANLMIDNVIIKNTGRGILFQSFASLSVVNSQIQQVLGNGISFLLPEIQDQLNSLSVYNSVVKDADAIGIELINTYNTSISYTELMGCKGGGIVGYKSGFNVSGCIIANNCNMGVAYIESYGFIIGNYINNTHPRESDGKFGDGISVLLRGLSQSGDTERAVRIFNNIIIINNI